MEPMDGERQRECPQVALCRTRRDAELCCKPKLEEAGTVERMQSKELSRHFVKPASAERKTFAHSGP
jgi:hypothetical protein